MGLGEGLDAVFTTHREAVGIYAALLRAGISGKKTPVLLQF
jgi:hypothetical protein